MRKTWDEYFMDIAFKISERGTCNRLQVGSVLVKDKRIKSSGYNGSPEGQPHCSDVGCYLHNNHCIRTIHSEANCLNLADVEDKQGATIYVTHYPCPDCQKLIISSKIKRVVYANYYEPTVDWLAETDIEVVHLSDYKQQSCINKQEIAEVVDNLEMAIEYLTELQLSPVVIEKLTKTKQKLKNRI